MGYDNDDRKKMGVALIVNSNSVSARNNNPESELIHKVSEMRIFLDKI